MNFAPAPLERNPALEPAADFYELRRRGIGFIEKMGSKWWTDYNLHDPGITILEAVSYAITDISYRMDWDITDILAPPTPSGDLLQPYPAQAFFTARHILTVNPVTVDDFRRLLIDLPRVRDAWLTCKQCACETSYLAWCEDDKLQLGYVAPGDLAEPAQEVHARGLYEVLLELENDPDLGDLNDRKIVHSYTHREGGRSHPVLLEFRFPEVDLVAGQAWDDFLGNDAVFADPTSFGLTLTRLGATKNFDIFSELATAAERDAYIRLNWRLLFYADFQVEVPAGTPVLTIENVAIRIFADNAVRDATTAADWKDMLENRAEDGLILRYRSKAKAALSSVANARVALHAHRNLDEDYCVIRGVNVEEVAACADVEVRQDADIERIQAEIWFELAQYFNPPVPFRSLRELRDSGMAVEDIFNGPALENGFIRADELAAAALRRELRVSDILNKLMDIEGVVSVNKLLLTKYDQEGNVARGAADPQWVNGLPVFDPNKISASWLLFVSPGHQPRLYRNQSRFLFFKNGLPFLPRMDEAESTLSEIAGAAERLKMPGQPNDLPVPSGQWRQPADYFPVQYSLPAAYGTGPAGLPSGVSAQRKAQAKQLKAYLMVFEQFLGSALAQFAHSADLFSLDPAVTQTYFSMKFKEETIKGYDGLATAGLTEQALQGLTETETEFLARRNMFLDHLLARFGEDFSAFALLLAGNNGSSASEGRLIANKIAFLKRYPVISHDRGKAFNYTIDSRAPGNEPGIKTRVTGLLGFPDLAFEWTVAPAGGGQFTVEYQLVDGAGAVRLAGAMTLAASDAKAATSKAARGLLARMAEPTAWDIAAQGPKFRLMLLDAADSEMGRYPELIAERAVAEMKRDELLAWSANNRLIVVEHLLLRPKFPGDALYPACCDDGCGLCGEEDPYSFRLTFVMPGWTPEFAENLDFRHFAERTIREETPAHLLAKICWAGNAGMADHPCDGIIEDLATLLEERALTGGGNRPDSDEACACAAAIHQAFLDRFAIWHDGEDAATTQPDAVAGAIGQLFAGGPSPADTACTLVLDQALWSDLQAMLTDYFIDVTVNGRQFERFERVWHQWLEANAEFDWSRERLQARVEALLTAYLQTPETVNKSDICACARTILASHGAAFSDWLDAQIRDGVAPADLGEPPAPVVAACPGLAFKAGAAAAVAQLLTERYRAYSTVSYWLRALVGQLAAIRNIYPGATLHDCDDGSDENPVRLNNTALGNYPRRTTLT